MLDVLFIDPYFGGSHRDFAEGYRRSSRHRIKLLTMPAHKWKWRMRGGALYLADHLPDALPDVLLVTDFLDLATLTALRPDFIAELPTAAYFHENQLTYPLRDEEERDFQFGLTNMTTCLAADRVLFNSSFHRQDFLEATDRLLRKMPDCVPEGLATRIRDRSQVIPVGVDLSPIDDLRATVGPPEGPLRILWNHRWEFDKAPETFFGVIRRLENVGLDYKLAVAGQSFRRSPEVFERARTEFAHRLKIFGTVPSRRDYLRLLLKSDVVVSTAIHEFFGIAVVEAAYAGCTPLLPRRLSYPELLPSSAHESCLYEGEDDLFDRLRQWALRPQQARCIDLREAMGRFKWEKIGPRLDGALERLCASAG